MKTETEAQIIEKRVRLEGSEADKRQAEIEADCLWKLNIAGRPLCVCCARACVVVKETHTRCVAPG